MARHCSNDDCPDYLATGVRQEFTGAISSCSSCGASLVDGEVPMEPHEPSFDPAQIAYLQQRLHSEQNLLFGSTGAALASLAGAGVWAALTVSTGYQIGFMAIGVGFLVGFAVRNLGKGVTSTFGVVGASFSLLGCALGNLLAVTAIVARAQGVRFFDAVSQLTAPLALELMVAFFSPFDLLFYAIALYYGYKLSFRQLTEQDLQAMLSGGTAA